MKTNFKKVEEFHNTFGVENLSSPNFPAEKIQQLRIELIREEFEELKEAIDDNDIVEVADALTDILYVVYGAGLSFGIDLDKCFEEVHRSNMSKLTKDGKVLRRESDGKVLKSDQFSPPDLKSILLG
jgi:predicted HAD superfamily Cof-like phosphohydrolase